MNTPENIKDNSIVFFHPAFKKEVFEKIKNKQDLILVCTQADSRSKALFADYHIVQNPTQADGRSIYIPHFPQVGLIKRDTNRRHILENLSFMGESQNLDIMCKNQTFDSFLNQHHLTFHYSFKKEQWIDYSKSDLIVAIRQNKLHQWFNKPATKIFNAWLAEVPIIVGKEKGFKEIKKSELDFIEVGNQQELFKAIMTLKNNPNLYLDMIENGKERAKDYDFESTIDRWIDVIENEIIQPSVFAQINRNRYILPISSFIYKITHPLNSLK